MGKVKTSVAQKKSSAKLIEHKTPAWLGNPKAVMDALMECLAKNELEGFQDILVAHLGTVNKLQLAKETGIGRRTLYDLLDPSKPFNPTLSTLGPIFNSLRKR